MLVNINVNNIGINITPTQKPEYEIIVFAAKGKTLPLPSIPY
jgi:hypothetical protein